MQITTIGLDIAKNVFQVHGIDAAEKMARAFERVTLQFGVKRESQLGSVQRCRSGRCWRSRCRAPATTFLLMQPAFARAIYRQRSARPRESDSVTNRACAINGCSLASSRSIRTITGPSRSGETVTFAMTWVPQMWVKKSSSAGALEEVAGATVAAAATIVWGPRAPMLPTSKVTSILPAFSNISAAAMCSPSLKGASMPMNIRWLPPGASVTLAPGGMVSPPSTGRTTSVPRLRAHESAVVGRIFLQQENWRRAIWDFCNNIGSKPTLELILRMSAMGLGGVKTQAPAERIEDFGRSQIMLRICR